MSDNVQSGLEDVWTGRPSWDDPHHYSFVHETIRDHRPKKPGVPLCFDCMENPKMEQIGDKKPLRCDGCEYKYQRRMRAAAAAKGGY